MVVIHMVMLAFIRYRALSGVRFPRLPIAPSLRPISSDSDDDAKNGKPLLGRVKGAVTDFDFESVKQSSKESSGFKKESQNKLLRPQEETHHRRQLSESVAKMDPLSRGTSKFDADKKVQRMPKTEKGNRHPPFKDTFPEGKTQQESVGDLSKLLSSLKESRTVLGREKLRSVLSARKVESKILGNLIPAHEEGSSRNAGLSSGQISQLKNLKDLEEKVASSRPVPPKVDAVLDRKIKGLLSELKVQSRHAAVKSNKGIVAAVENLGKSIPNQRKDIKLDYKAQVEDWQTTPTVDSKMFGFYSGNRPELFDSAFKKSKAVKPEEESQSPFLLQVRERNGLDIQQTGKTHNAFKNQINLSNQLWQYPIDNEVCKVDEQNVSFEEHIFLEYLLDDFPSKGPVRQFMELVINGLQQNPHLSVNQKKERVHWFHDYFSQFKEEDLNF